MSITAMWVVGILFAIFFSWLGGLTLWAHDTHKGIGDISRKIKEMLPPEKISEPKVEIDQIPTSSPIVPLSSSSAIPREIKITVDGYLISIENIHTKDGHVQIWGEPSITCPSHPIICPNGIVLKAYSKFVPELLSGDYMIQDFKMAAAGRNIELPNSVWKELKKIQWKFEMLKEKILRS